MADGPGLGAFVARGIRARRVWLNLDQAELGRRVGRSAQTVSEIERGNRRLAVDDLPAFCRALETTFAALAQGADPDDLQAVGLT
jgi:transcriptional regulator with XRE-family HTH domain